MPTPSDSEFFGLEGFFMRWTTFGVPLLVMSSEYESMNRHYQRCFIKKALIPQRGIAAYMLN